MSAYHMTNTHHKVSVIIFNKQMRKCMVIIENQDLQADRHLLTFSHPNSRKSVSKPALATTNIGMSTLSPTVPIDAI